MLPGLVTASSSVAASASLGVKPPSRNKDPQGSATIEYTIVAAACRRAAMAATTWASCRVAVTSTGSSRRTSPAPGPRYSSSSGSALNPLGSTYRSGWFSA